MVVNQIGNYDTASLRSGCESHRTLIPIWKATRARACLEIRGSMGSASVPSVTRAVLASSRKIKILSGRRRTVITRTASQPQGTDRLERNGSA